MNPQAEIVGWGEPAPDVSMDEYEAQPTLRQVCPICHAQVGVSCTVPIRVSWSPEWKRQQVMEFHQERVPAEDVRQTTEHEVGSPHGG